MIKRFKKPRTSTKVRQESFLAEVQSIIVAERPDQSGRIDWATARHLFFTGVPAKEAAKKMLAILS